MAAAAAASSAASSGSSIYTVSEEKTNGTRLARLLVDGGTHVLRKVFHSFHPPATLQQVLNNNRRKLQSMRSRRVLFDDQWEKLFPSSGDPPDSTTFDITLLHLLLREICDLTAPPTGWHKMPADGDGSREANIVRIKCHRNELCHSVSTGIRDTEFEDKWNKVSKSLVALGLDQQEIDRLKTDPIDHDTKRRVDEEVGKWKLDFEPRVQNLEQEVQQLKERIQGPISGHTAPCELSSCLPDEVRNVFGRSQEIRQVIEAVQSGTVSIAVITGGPGFGKTTVANKVAHELAKSEGCKSVLCCSLGSKAELKDIATTMILTCSKSHSQPPENPQHWLLNWSKQLMEKVTFVLDNSDDIVESDSRVEFVNMLRQMRSLSNHNLTFIITSRRTVSAPNYDFEIRNIRLACLSADEASNLLLSKVYNVETKQKLSQTAKIVKLCGYVPLALCIVGSLLSDYKEDKLIKSLEEEPLDVLQDDEISLEKAMKTSFDLLKEAEQKALTVLSVFPGSFDSDAAEAVIIAGMDTSAQPVVRTLPFLKNRSLLEQPSSCRYEVHQLIQAFVRKVSRDRYSRDIAQAEEMACTHFISRLANNANMYWSKDKCKDSVEAFNVDRHNFEYFLQVYTDMRREIEDQEMLKSCKTFLDDFPQKCMYLEMCVLPRFYIFILEKLLKTFDSKTQPVHRVELLCLLGHEVRKEGDTEKYNDNMEEARKLYEENTTDFQKNPLSQVIYLQSYARFLSERKAHNETKKVFQKALRICEEKLTEHPERAAVLLFAGRNDKYWEKMEAFQKIDQALQLFNKCLGEHFMTAQCLKNFADLIFFRCKTEGGPKEALSYYKKALEMMEKLEMDGGKGSIMTLKNYGLCHKNKGNFEEARNLLTKAERVAERELNEDHMWKVMVKTEQALLHDEEGKTEQMEETMKKGLQMCYRLRQTVEKLGNKHRIRKTLNRHPELFPNDEYPR